MIKLPDKIQDILRIMVKSLEWNTLKSDSSNVLHYRYKQYETGYWSIVVYPAIHEVIGGKHDGKLIYQQFGMEMLSVYQAFTEVLEMRLDTKKQTLTIAGLVDEMLVSFLVCSTPPPKAKALKNYNWYKRAVEKKA